MFDREWAFKNGDDISPRKLPYFYTDPVTNTVIEMTNCDYNTKRNLGWYQIEFKNNYENRPNTNWESVGTLYYNKLNDSVECHSFVLKDSWRNMLYQEIEALILSYLGEPTEKITNLLSKINLYFMNEKYDNYQLVEYYKIFKNSAYDIAIFVDNVNEYEIDGITAFELLFFAEPNFRQQPILMNYIKQNLNDFAGKNIISLGLTSSLTAAYFNKNNFSSKALDNIFYHSTKFKKFHVNLNCVLTAINNDLYFDVLTKDNFDDIDGDVFIFANPFYDTESAAINLQYMQTLKQKGKRTIILSPSLWNENNEFVNFPKENLQELYTENGITLFTFK
jgi:hypothetical protein